MSTKVFSSTKNGKVRVNYTESIDVTANTSIITVTSVDILSTGYYGYAFYAEGSVYINGTEVLAMNASVPTSGVWVGALNEWYELSNTSCGPVTVSHNADGTGTFAIRLAGRSTSSYNDLNIWCANSNGNFSVNSTKYQELTVIDRNAPTVYVSTDINSTTQFTINATSDYQCNYWYYRLNGGGWVLFAQNDTTSVSYAVSGLGSAVYHVEVTARRTYNEIWSAYSSTYADIVAPSVSCVVSNVTASSIKIDVTANVTSNIWEYSIDGGNTWSRISTVDGTSASVVRGSLAANATYNVRARAMKSSNCLYGYSNTIAVKTLGGSVLNSVIDFAADVSTPTISINATIYGSYYHALYINNGGIRVAVMYLGLYSAGTNQNKIVTLDSTQKAALLSIIPAAKQFAATLDLVTFADDHYSAQVGFASSKGCNVTTSEIVSRPVFTDFAYEDTEAATLAVTENEQILIQGISDLKVTADVGAAQNGASITGYSISIGNVSISGISNIINAGVINTSGNLILRVTCTDSRGYSTSVEKTVTVLAYAGPRLTSHSLRRQNEIDALIQLSFSGSISTIRPDGNTEKNSLAAIQYQYKQTDAQDYGPFTSLLESCTINGTMFSFSSDELLELDENTSYDYHLQIRDQLGSVSSYDLVVVITQGTPLVALRKRNSTYNYQRVGINNPTPVRELDVIGRVGMNGQNVMGYIDDLSDSEDLNSVIQQGIYTQLLDANASAAHHYPQLTSGYLEVLVASHPESDYIMQRYTAYNCSGMYLRNRYENVWSSWKSVTLT